MVRRVLSVGQCAADTALIGGWLKEHFDVEVMTAEQHSEAVELARQKSFDLILVNRVLDVPQTEGMEVLEALKMDPTTNEMPVMIVSNFADAQEKAIQAGGVSGFGKAELGDNETVAKLEPYLKS